MTMQIKYDEILRQLGKIEGTVEAKFTGIDARFDAIDKRLDEIIVQAKKTNGCVAEQEKHIATHDTELALLKQTEARQESNWSKVWDVAIKPILLAVIGAAIVIVASK